LPPAGAKGWDFPPLFISRRRRVDGNDARVRPVNAQKAGVQFGIAAEVGRVMPAPREQPDVFTP